MPVDHRRQRRQSCHLAPALGRPRAVRGRPTPTLICGARSTRLRTPHRQPPPPQALQPTPPPRLLPVRPDQHHPRSDSAIQTPPTYLLAIRRVAPSVRKLLGADLVALFEGLFEAPVNQIREPLVVLSVPWMPKLIFVSRRHH